MKNTMSGVDLAKSVFQLHGASLAGHLKFRKKVMRVQFLHFMAKHAPAVVVMEACGGASYRAREMVKLNQAICQRAPSEADKLIHHSDQGSRYLSIRYTERLSEAGIDTSVGSVGDSCDNALAESIIGLFRTGVIKSLGPLKSVGQVESETLKWVDWHNNTRLHSAIG